MSSRVKNKVSAAVIVRGTGAVPVPAVQIVTMAPPQIQPSERAAGASLGGKSHSGPSLHRGCYGVAEMWGIWKEVF